MSVLERIIKNRKKLVEVEKRRDIIKELSNLINQLDIDIEKKKKLKLSKAIKTAKEIILQAKKRKESLGAHFML